MQERICLAVAALMVLGLQTATAHAWGPEVHRRITLEAIDTLPKPIKGYYKAHRFELPSLDLEATPVPDARERRFAVDRVAAFPFPELPFSEQAFSERFGEQAGELGRLPWLTQESYARLVEAFKEGSKERILSESDVLAGLVADVSNPLALTENADGQMTRQHGLWLRFTTRLPEAMGRRLKLRGKAAHFIDDPRRHVFAMLRGSYVWLDNLLYEEELARRGQVGLDAVYYEALEFRAGRLLRDRLEQAVNDVASFWYSAWTAAGRPKVD